MGSADPRENREIIEQVIQYAENWEKYRKEQLTSHESDYDPLGSRKEYAPFRLLSDYVHSLSSEQLDAVFCAYELGGGLDGYAQPKLVEPEADEEDDDEDEVHRFNSTKEWVDWAINDYLESKKDEPNWIDYQRDADRLISMNSLSKCLKQAICYLFDDQAYFL